LKVQKEKIQAIVDKHQGLKKNLIAILLDIQAEYNYLPQESLTTLAGALDISLIEILDVATFYRAFSLTPRGKHLALVCLGTACHVRGGHRILEEFERKLQVSAGGTTPDNRFTLETVACLGCCAIGPVVQIGGDYHGHTTIGRVGEILKKYHKPGRGAAKSPRRARSSKRLASRGM
jgi:NADH-quinone oxidoreductase subunit E